MVNISIVSGILLFLICIAYSALVEYTHRRWPAARHYVFFEVILGCVTVISAASFAIGLEKAIVVAIYFCIAGLPMSVGAIIGHVLDDHRADKQRLAKEIRGRMEEG